MSMEEVYQECLGMKVDKTREFELSEKPVKYAVGAISMRLLEARNDGTGISFRLNGLHLSA